MDRLDSFGSNPPGLAWLWGMVFAEMQRKSGFIWRRPWKSRTVIAAGENVAGLSRGCDGQEREFGPDHCDVATTLSNLGNAYDRLGNIQKQKELLERALDINEREYGVALRALVNSNIRMCYDVFAFSHGNSDWFLCIIVWLFCDAWLFNIICMFFYMFSFEVVGEERLRSRSSCRGNHLGEPGQRLWKVRCLRCPGTQQRDGITADDIFCHLDKIRYSNTVIHCASAMKCQMHWQHPSSIYIIWFGPSCRLGEHETQRDILERALGIMEAEFGANSHKVHCMAQHGASGGFVFITGFLGGFLCMHVYGSWQGGRDHDGYDILWHIMTSYD